MNKFLVLIISVLFVVTVFAKSPHGEGFKIDCSNCHVTSNWEQLNPRKFNHNKTRFPLVGQHKTVECRICHPTLEFAKAKNQCIDCHMDMHEGTVGHDCERCHNSKSWIVTNVKQVHQQAGFALIGAHANADCNLCHKSGSMLRFNNIQTDCYSCHNDRYYKTTKPNHISAGFNTDCFRCHNMTGMDWSSTGKGFEHGFFPLTGGHSNLNCFTSKCHANGLYKGVPTTCVSCHLDKYNATTNPAHSTVGFSTDCQSCHSINSWTPATFDHEKYFPIKSGRHSGINCSECHTNATNYKSFTCVTSSCHGNAHHQNQGSSGCYSCHSTGRGGD